MRKIAFVLSVIVSMLQSLPQQANAVVNISSVNGAVCDPLLSSHSKFLEKRAIGLVNICTTTDVYVVCPGISISESTDLPIPYVVFVSMSNNGTSSVAEQRDFFRGCRLRS